MKNFVPMTMADIAMMLAVAGCTMIYSGMAMSEPGGYYGDDGSAYSEKAKQSTV